MEIIDKNLDKAFDDLTGIAQGKGQKKQYTIIILDESGSMHSLKKVAVDSFNEQIDMLNTISMDIKTLVTFRTFSTTPNKPIFWNESIDNLKKLEPSDYRPDGGTALLDCIGDTIERMMPIHEAEKDNDTAFLVVIISDGEENQSEKYSVRSGGYEKIAKMITELQDTKRWTFTYLGANVDLSKVSEALHIPVGNIRGFDSTVQGYTVASEANNAAYINYYNIRGLTNDVKGFASSSFYSDIKAEKKEEEKLENIADSKWVDTK
jgi:hypothetical protein